MRIKEIKFGGTGKEQDQLANLVLQGRKVATSSLVVLQELVQARPTTVGDFWQIMDSQNNKICMVQVKKVAHQYFSNIDEEFAIKEGDGTLANWEKIHQDYYSKILNDYNLPLIDETILECVYFEKIANKDQE